MADEQIDLADWFARMARDLLERGTVAETLGEVCELAVVAIEPCRDAGISQLHRGQRIETPAATSRIVADLHTLQYELNEGPCMEAAWEQHTIRVDDLTSDQRWPRFAERAAESGLRSMVCFQLFTHKGTLGALNLFSDQPGAFDQHAVELGLVFASHAAIALARVQNETTLRSAISTRQQIGEASGILAARHHITTSEAFGMLVRASQNSNTALREIAARLVAAENAAAERKRR